MNFLDANLSAMLTIARERSSGTDIDKYWNRVLPEAQGFAANEIFLTLHRFHINQLMKTEAAQVAQNTIPRDIDELDHAELWLYYFTCEWWLNISHDRIFQSLVDHSYGVNSKTADANRWVRPSLVWVPHSHMITPKIHRSLVERYKYRIFARRCFAKLIDYLRKKEHRKYTFILLGGSHGMHQRQNDALQRLTKKSISIDPDVGEDALQDWLHKLLRLPWHQRVQKIGATRKAIRDLADDIRNKGSKYEHVPFDEDLTNPFPGGSAEAPDEELIADEYPKRLVECQPELEALLSDGRTDNPKQGERRFKILQLLARTPDLHSSTIATQLKTSPATICRDRKVIDLNKDRIQEILTG